MKILARKRRGSLPSVGEGWNLVCDLHPQTHYCHGQQPADPEAHPRHKEMAALIERWRQATGHAKSKASKDRFDLIRARFNDGYEIETLELAIDGLGAFPFVVSAERRQEGPPAQRYDQLKHALNGGQDLERFANLGHRARKDGLT